MNPRLRGLLPFGAVIALLPAACSKGDPIGPRTPTKIEIVGGTNQSGPIGDALPAKIIVRASDGEGPLAGISITASTETDGGGSASPRNLTTAANGEAQTTWTLGSKLGTQALTFTTTGVSAVSVTAGASLGNPALISPVSEAFQYTVVNRPVTGVPKVRVTDLFNNPIPGVAVTFEPEGGSTVTGATPSTGADGTATIGSWTIGPNAVTYTLRARITGGTVATFQAQGVPATFTVVDGNGQTANAGTQVTTAPAVRAGRDDGSPIPGVLVSFAVTVGGGLVQGTPVTTGGDGIARATRWILGGTPGANAAEARILGKDPLTFQATGVVGTATSAVASSLVSQSGFFGNFVPATPSLMVTDGAGNPVAGVPVTFQVTLGDGQLTGATKTTGFDGQARLGSWRLGTSASQAVQATSPAFAPVSFNATASAAPASTFTIEIRFITSAPAQTPTAAQQAAFDLAVARWRQIILAGGAPYLVNEAACGIAALNETVPGVVIFAKLQPIDGVRGILGQAGPCIVRDDPPYHSAMGIMLFDTADLAFLEGDGQLNTVILHEMGHVLGIGTLWDFLSNALLVGRGGGDPVFIGPATVGPFFSTVAPGTTFTGKPVPVENIGPIGTRDSHWRESILGTELMTGTLDPGVSHPLSAFTATSLRDLGYLVNDAVTETFSFQAFLESASGPAGFQPAFGSLRLAEVPIEEPIVVINRRGQAVRRVAR